MSGAAGIPTIHGGEDVKSCTAPSDLDLILPPRPPWAYH
jgi:hypothetical protein